jgi:CBS-domain-containing membrane protein
MSTFFDKLTGGAARPPAAAPKAIALAAAGGFVAIALVALLTQVSGNPWVLGSLGASCVMLFGFPDLPFSQPRHVIGGHVLSSAIGLLCLGVLGATWLGMALALGLALAAMMLLRVPHPPAGSNPIIIFLSAPSWGFLVFPTLTGAVAIVIVALIYNNLTRDTPFPKYW